MLAYVLGNWEFRDAFLFCSISFTFTALAGPFVATVTSAVPFLLDVRDQFSGVGSFPLVAIIPLLGLILLV